MATRVNIGAKGIGGSRALNLCLTAYNDFAKVVNAEAFRIFQGAAQIVLNHTYPFVPVQYGGLSQSGAASAEVTPKGVRGKVTFGGIDNPVTPTPNAPLGIVTYALIVHENAEGRGYKYLEQGAESARIEYDTYIKAELAAIPKKRVR